MCNACSELRNSGEMRKGYAWVGPRLREVVYTVDQGEAFAEGCIVLGTEEEVAAATAYVQRTHDTLGTVIANPRFLWPNSRVAYEIDGAVPQPERITEAIQHYRSKTTHVTFIERSAANRAFYPDWIVFRAGGRGAGCTSRVGCLGGRQFITIEEGCRTGNVIHEIGHALGLFHEQSRSDRDQYVTIHMDRVLPAARHNFDQALNSGKDLGSYDYESIMHYPADAFGIGGAATIVPRQEGVRIGQRDGLSAGDVRAIEMLYP